VTVTDAFRVFRLASDFQSFTLFPSSPLLSLTSPLLLPFRVPFSTKTRSCLSSHPNVRGQQNHRFIYQVLLSIKEDSLLQVVNLTDALLVIIIVRKICVQLSRRNARQARLKLETILAARSTLRKPLIHAWFTEINLVTASDLPALLAY
jgi:hypothetical protein